MPAFAIAHLRQVDLGPEVVEYMERIDDTLAPYGGAFRVHGALPEVMEGEFPGVVVVIEFPGMREARGWYHSEAYRQILHLRTDHSAGETILVEGVEPGYLAGSYAAKLAAPPTSAA